MNERLPTIEDVQEATCHFFGLKVKDLIGKERARHLIEARHVSMFICRKLKRFSFPSIGRAFNRNHTTVVSACQKMEKRVENDVRIRMYVQTIEKVIEVRCPKN